MQGEGARKGCVCWCLHARAPCAHLPACLLAPVYAPSHSPADSLHPTNTHHPAPRVLYKLEDRVRPYVHKILVVIEPLLIDEDYYARVEGREIIANLAKAAGLAQMIAAMRPDIDNIDECVGPWGGAAAAACCLLLLRVSLGLYGWLVLAELV